MSAILLSPTIETTPVDACPLCGSRDHRILFRDVPDRRLGVSGAWTFVRCRACAVVFQTPRPIDPAAAYPRDYDQHRTYAVPRIETSPPMATLKTWMRRAILAASGYDAGVSRVSRAAGRVLRLHHELRYAAFHASLIQPPGPPRGRLLDLGCGNGRFVAWARLVGWDTYGVESDPVSAAIARRISGAAIYASLADLPVGDEAFDVITANHVLEHLPDPAATLARVHRLLQPGGTLYICVPNWNSFGRYLFGTGWIGLEPSRHLVMFDRRRLRRLVEQTGFHVESVRTTMTRERARFDENWMLRFGRSAPPVLVRALTLASIVADFGNDEIILRARRAPVRGDRRT
jgi:SAM-dependent methyltransferase